MMVQLDVLLVERTIANEEAFGLNLLRIGTRAAKQGSNNSFTFSDPRAYGVCDGLCQGALSPFVGGITDFLLTLHSARWHTRLRPGLSLPHDAGRYDCA